MIGRIRNFKVEIRESDVFGTISIFFYTEEDEEYIFAIPTKDGFELKRVNQGSSVFDGEALKIPHNLAKNLYHALGKFFVPNKNVTEEELKATKYHLEDMRKLVFENAKTIKEI